MLSGFQPQSSKRWNLFPKKLKEVSLSATRTGSLQVRTDYTIPSSIFTFVYSPELSLSCHALMRYAMHSIRCILGQRTGPCHPP